MLNDADFNDIVKITVNDGTILTGELTVPEDCKAIIVFVHGSKSNRLSPRNKSVAEVLQREKFATLLVNLLAPEDEHQLDIDMLADRLISFRDWLDQNPYTEALYIGFIATSSGAAPALKAAAKYPGKINALVCRGGRPDLVADILNQVQIPVLFTVGSKDKEGIESNKKALSRMACECDLKIIEGAGHSFEEQGRLEEFAELARDWFLRTI